MSTHFNAEIPTDPFKYKGSSKSELGIGDEVMKSELFDYSDKNGQRIGIYVTEPRRSDDASTTDPGHERASTGRTIIVPAAWEYRIEPLWASQLQLMAAHYDAKVIGVEMPGTVGLTYPSANGEMKIHDSTRKLQGANQTLGQLANGVRGDFRSHVNVQLDAIDAVVGLSKSEAYVLYGTSMGATIATEMITALRARGCDIDQLILHETVNAFSGNRPGVMAKVAKLLAGLETDRRLKYIAENHAIGHNLTAFELSGDSPAEIAWRKELDDARKRQQRIAGLSNVVGMSYGRESKIMNSLNQLDQSEAPTVTLIRGRESAAALEQDYARMQEVLSLGGYATRLYTVTDESMPSRPIPLGHAHHFSIGRFKDILNVVSTKR